MAVYEYIAHLPNNQVKCTLCNDLIHNSSTLLEAHIHNKKHKGLYIKTLMKTNNIIIGTTDLYCYICTQRIPITELMCHVQSITHQNNFSSIKSLLDLDGGLICPPDKNSSHSSAFCLICNKHVELIYESLKMHINSELHRRAKAMVLQPLNGIFSVKDHDKYLWCKICQIYFDNYIEVIFQHVFESDHAKTIGKLLRLTKGQNVDMERYLQDLKEDQAWCKSCNVGVACNVLNLQSHITGKKHKKSS